MASAAQGPYDRLMKIVAFVIGFAALWVTSPAVATQGSLVVRDLRVTAVYALHGTVLYDRAGPDGERGHWRRVVRGRVFRPRGIPKGATAGTVGLDALGNTVITMRTSRAWWVYDVVHDTARRLGRLGHRSCVIHAVALWRSRIAYADGCGSDEDAVMLREGGVARRVGSGYVESLTLRGRSIVARETFEDAQNVVPIVSEGTTCRPEYGPWDIFVGYRDENPQALDGAWIGSAGVEWVKGNQTDTYPTGAPDPKRPAYTDLVVGSVDLNGHCASPTVITVRHLAVSPPDSAVHAASIDGRWLYLATDTGIYRQRLAARGVPTTPPGYCPGVICG